MRNARPLPRPLDGSGFTFHEAVLLGVPPDRLRAQDLRSGGRLVYFPASADPDLHARARALSAATPGAWLSHASAALLHGLWLPQRMSLPGPLHLSKPHTLPEVRRRGVHGHSVRVFEGEVMELHGVSISTPARTWLDLAASLRLEELTAMGDQLIRIPRPAFDGRTAPYALISGLRQLIGRHPNMHGVVRCRQALELLRIGADSAPETLLRLGLCASGLPEPELQLRLVPEDPWSPAADMGYRRWRIAIQYDGGHHLSSEQQTRDNRRDEAFMQARWSYFKFNREDLKDSFRAAAAKIARAIEQARID